MINCLVVSSDTGLTNDIAVVLFLMALSMNRQGVKMSKVEAEDFVGEVTTEFKSGLLGEISGVVFQATLETISRGTIHVVFIIRRKDLKEDRLRYDSQFN